MLYFKNPELAKEYHVTLRTVLNWIEAAKKDKLDLTLHTEKGRTYVANTARNIALIKQLVEDRKKYRNTKAAKTVSPRPEFYKLFTQAQIYDIATDLEVHHEIARQYNYFGPAAARWDEYTQHLAAESTSNMITGPLKIFAHDQSYIDSLITQYKHVNVVDIGVGNALPVKSLLKHLTDKGLLKRYVALDISEGILRIAERNIKKWFGNKKVPFESYEMDINYDRFSNILAEGYLNTDKKGTLNLILMLGGTHCNFRNPDGAFRIIHDSMGLNDVLIHTQKLDSHNTRKFFDFNVKPGTPSLAPIHEHVVSLLNIDKSFYDVELGFDEAQSERYTRIRLKVALTIQFDFNEGRRLVSFDKNDTILVWRYRQQTALDVIHQFDRNDFYLLHTSQTEDQEYILTVSRVRRDLSD